MIWTDDQVRSLYGDRLSTTAATMAPLGSGCSGTNPLHGVFSDTDPIIIVHVHVCVGGEEEIMCLGPQQHPGSRGPCYDSTPWKL